MTSLLTRDEHHARAMLMGREYDETDGTYCQADFDGLGWVIDCMTFEVIDYDMMSMEDVEVFKRRKKWERND